MREKSSRYIYDTTAMYRIVISPLPFLLIFRQHHSVAQADMVRSEVDTPNMEENSPRKLEKDVLDYLLQISQQLEKVLGSILSLYQ